MLDRCGLGCASCSCPALSSEGVGGPGGDGGSRQSPARGHVTAAGSEAFFGADTSPSERYCTQLGVNSRIWVVNMGILEAGREALPGAQALRTMASRAWGDRHGQGFPFTLLLTFGDGLGRAIQCFIGAFRVGCLSALGICLFAIHLTFLPSRLSRLP